MKWARIENGVVMEITGIDPVGRFVKEIEQQFVSCGDDVEQGYLFNGGVFSESPGPTLAELQDQSWLRIKAERDRREQAGAPYLGKALDSDEKSVTRISIAVQAAQAAISAGTSFSLDWTMQDNSVVSMTAAEVVGMSVALATHSNGLHLAARAVREKILAATDAAGVEAAEKVVVWPE